MTSLNELLAQRAAAIGHNQKPTFTPPTTAAEPNGEHDASFNARARSWARKALDGRAERLAAMQVGEGRNVELNKSTFVLLRFAIAGHLDSQEVIDTMGEADGGADYPATRRTLESAWNGAHRHGALDPPIDATSQEDFFDLAYGQAASGPQPEGVEVPPMPDVTSQTPEERAKRRLANMVASEIETLRVREEAKRLFAAEVAARDFREPVWRRTLTEELLIPDEPIRYSIDKILPKGGNALLTAQYKAGKTTLISNLARSWADDEPFLGQFTMDPARLGRMAIFNYELSESQYRAWLRELGIKNTDAVSVLHLRGYRLPLTSSRIEDWIVGWLKEHDVTFWIADPFARAAVGVDENSNTEVGVWLDTFDVIKERAGVGEAVLPVHTGRGEQEQGQERARGATRLDDWADVRWILTRDDEGERYFRATGRDVEIDEEKLTFDNASRRLSFGGGDRNWVRRRRLEDAVVAYVRDHPGSSSAIVEREVEGKTDALRAALRGAVAGHRLRVEVGAHNARLHYSNE